MRSKENLIQSNCARIYIHAEEKGQYLACYLIFNKIENHDRNHSSNELIQQDEY